MNDVLLKVLEIIGYTENKDEFVNKFSEACQKEAMIKMISELPADQQNSVRQIIRVNPSDPQLLQYFNSDIYKSALKESSKKVFQQYLDSIVPTLSEDQGENLSQYLSSLQQASS